LHLLRHYQKTPQTRAANVIHARQIEHQAQFPRADALVRARLDYSGPLAVHPALDTTDTHPVLNPVVNLHFTHK
jgi:hypothetical protein